MNALDDDLRTLLHRQAAAMRVPTPSLDHSLTPVGHLDATRQRRWLPAVAAVAVIAVGGAALLQRATPAGPAAVPVQAPQTQPVAAGAAPFSFATPTVRMTAQTIEVVVGDRVIVPTAVAVRSDPGSSEATTLELSWTDGDVAHRLNIYFTSDGTSWWADEIRTTDAAGEWVSSGNGQRWFTSPLGTAWSGDLDLVNLRITGLRIEAFIRPAACEDPVVPIAVVSAYATIEGWAGGGFGARIDLIDTATCTLVDPDAYDFITEVEDPTIAVVTHTGPLPTATTVPAWPTTTIVADPTSSIGGAVDGGFPPSTALAERWWRFEMNFLRPGRTTVGVTVIDQRGVVIGRVDIPVVVREGDPTTVDTTVSTSTTFTEPGVTVDTRVFSTTTAPSVP